MSENAEVTVNGAGMGNIVFTGMMGTGKTAVGRYLAEQLKVPFYDLDELIEQESGLDVPAPRHHPSSDRSRPR